uniref:Uncharacterized protein n=1 Tax=Anopheles atroparvus TaxID=41427 RepID=A0A182JKX0_ANOAO
MKVNCVICVVLLFYVIDTGMSQSVEYSCDGDSDGYYHRYEPSITFSNVFINSSISYSFNCAGSDQRTTISFINSTLDDVPKKLFDTFRNLKDATLSNCNIQNINGYSMERASSLQILDISKNALQEVKSYAFTGADNLVNLNLALNRISTIDPTAFHLLPKLQILNLERNKLRMLDGALFTKLVEIRFVMLNHNELELIEEGLFQENTKLRYILLHNNRISVFDEMALGTNRPYLLTLWNNRLTKLNLRNSSVEAVQVRNNSLEEVYLSPWIEQLYAENNKISQIQADRSNLISIKTLSLKNNSISTLEMVSWMQTLEVLDLTGNKLGSLSIDSFAKLTNLQQLRLERTGITNLQHGTFAQQEKLLWLDLSYNNLDKIDLDILTSSTLLEELYLDGNRLKSIEYGNMKKMFPALTKLGLVDNRWNCTFLSNIVRYCNENGIQLIKGEPSEEVLKQPNVEGIFCYDEKNPIRHWNTTVEHLLSSNVSETGALQAMFQSVLDDVQRFGEGHSDVVDRTDKLEGTLSDLTRRQMSLENDLFHLHTYLIDLRVRLLLNRTNTSSVRTDELRRMIDSVNNLTLEKQHLSEERLELKINTLSFRVDQALETAKTNSDKLAVLGKRVEDWIGSMLSPGGGVGLFTADKHQPQLLQSKAESSGGSALTGLLVAVLVMVCLLTGVIVFALLRNSRRSYGTERRRYTNRDSSLTTIVD